MINAVAKRTFLMGQEILDGGQKKDIIAHRGERLRLNERDAIKFYGALKFKREDEDTLQRIAKTQKLNRII